MNARHLAHLAAAVALSFATARTLAAQAGSIIVRWGAGESRTLSAAEIKALPRHSAKIPGASTETSMVSGVSLWDVIAKAGAFPENASGRQRGVAYVKLTGADGQSAVVALVEIDPTFSERAALLVDTRDGKPLDASEGPWRAIMPTDLRHSRWIRGVASISVEAVR